MLDPGLDKCVPDGSTVAGGHEHKLQQLSPRTEQLLQRKGANQLQRRKNTHTLCKQEVEEDMPSKKQEVGERQ